MSLNIIDCLVNGFLFYDYGSTFSRTHFLMLQGEPVRKLMDKLTFWVKSFFFKDYLSYIQPHLILISYSLI